MQCQCEFGQHECGAKHRKRRCRDHQKKFPMVNVFTERSYRVMGLRADWSNYLREFRDGFGKIPPQSGKCLEVGCGVSPYVELIKQAGLSYEGCDLSPFACRWMKKNYAVTIYQGRFESIRFNSQYQMILAAHVLEHVTDAIAVISRMSSLLLPGGRLYLLIPDDEDLNNQDHQWFFTKESAITLIESVGLSVESSVVMKIVKRESFMYFVARKIN